MADEQEFLTHDELARLAPGLKQPQAIARRIRRAGLAAKVVDGQVLVSRVMMRDWLQAEAAPKQSALNWKAVP